MVYNQLLPKNANCHQRLLLKSIASKIFNLGFFGLRSYAIKSSRFIKKTSLPTGHEH